MSRRRRRLQDSDDKADIDMTPMLDVVFIMLIFFIVTASFVREVALNVNVPESNQQTSSPPTGDNTILVLVDQQSDVHIDGRRVDLRSVRSLIAQKSAAGTGAPSVVVRAHENSYTETYAAIVDASRDANVFDVSLIPYNDRRR